MKRKTFRTLAIVFAAALALSGCGGTTAEEPKEAAASAASDVENTEEESDTVESEETEEAAEETEEEDTSGEETGSSEGTGPQYTVLDESFDTGTEYSYGDFQRVEIIDDSHPALKEAVADYYDNARKDFEKICERNTEDAVRENEEAKASGEEDPYTAYYSYYVSAEVKRADEKLFSICVSEYSFTGGAHGTSYNYGVNFDTETGEILSEKNIGDVRSSLEDFVIKTIEGSGDDAKEMLFPEYRENVDSILSGDMDDIAYWFDDARMIVAFQQYDIAPYASGILEFGVPYSDLQGFNEKYLPDGDFCHVKLHDNGLVDFLDVDSDGEEDKVWIGSEDMDENGYATFVMHKDEESAKLNFEYYYSAEPVYVHSGDGDYFFITATSDNDWTDSEFYDARTMKLIDEFEGNVSSFAKDTITVSTREQVIGTWGGKKDYSYGPEGLSPKQDYFRINDNAKGDDRTAYTLLKDLSYHKEQGGEDTETLKKGDKIYPTLIYDKEMGFETESGETGFFYYEYSEEGGYTINGVNENDMFDGIVYAG